MKLWIGLRARGVFHQNKFENSQKCGQPIKTHEANRRTASNYYLNEYEQLTAFLENGKYEIGNGWVERQIKRFAIGRKNWLFCDTVEGAHASSVLYSLALTAKLNGKNPFEVMTKIFEELPITETAEGYERLARLLLSSETPQSCRKKEGAVIH